MKLMFRKKKLRSDDEIASSYLQLDFPTDGKIINHFIQKLETP